MCLGQLVTLLGGWATETSLPSLALAADLKSRSRLDGSFGGGGVVTNSCLTFVTSWTVAH